MLFKRNAFEETQCALKPATAEEVDEVGYYQANPDVKKVGMPAKDHFVQYGQKEGRIQWINEDEVRRIRERKIQTLPFKNKAVTKRNYGESINYISPEMTKCFDLPAVPPVSSNQYSESLNQEFRENPDKLFLDIGAGLRYRYFSNVVNSEIYPSICTDVICLGEDLPFEDETFDQVMAFSVLEHTKRPWDVAKEMCRVLKPGGKIINDYPFLQAVHGYPHHYFNATPQGHASIFSEWCDIQKVSINPNQTPIFSVWWVLALWRDGLSETDAAMFDEIRIKDILAHPPENQGEEMYCKNLSYDAQKLIAAGSTLYATKRAKKERKSWLSAIFGSRT